jgi:hypothetical protein
MFFRKTKTSGVTAEIRVRRCYGCGAILQDQDPNDVGYIPPEKFASDDDNLCERCYKLRHYSKLKNTGDFTIDYVTILNTAKEDHALVCYVINAFFLEGSILKGIGKFLPENVLFIINKRDLFNKSYSDEYLIRKTKKLLEKENIIADKIEVTSSSVASKPDSDLLARINSLRNGKDVYFVGAYQVGKSSLINALLLGYSNRTDKMITTSPYPGTTLDVISIPLDNDSYIYDTPGINNSSSIISFLEPEVVKYILPRNEVRPETYLAKEGQSFLFSNFARFDFVSGEKTNFTFYKSNDLTLQRSKIDKADNLLKSIYTNKNDPVRTEKVNGTAFLKKVTISALNDTINRIIITGLGFVEFSGKNQVIDVYVPQCVDVTLESNAI